MNLHQAQASLSRLVDRAAAGEEIIIAKAGRPMAKLVPAAGRASRRKPGGWKGRVVISRDFDAPLSAAVRRAFRARD